MRLQIVFPKAVLIFLKNFLDFMSDTTEKQVIINLSSFSNNSYAFIVLCDSEVTYLGEGENAAFCLFFICVLYIHSVAKSKCHVLKFSCLLYLVRNFVEACSFFSLIHFFFFFLLFLFLVLHQVLPPSTLLV